MTRIGEILLLWRYHFTNKALRFPSQALFQVTVKVKILVGPLACYGSCICISLFTSSSQIGVQ